MYIRLNIGLSGWLITNLPLLMEESGYKTGSHNKNSYEPFRKALLYLIEEEYITCDTDVLTVRNTYFRITLTKKKNLFFTDEPFVFLSFYEYEKICRANTRISKSTLLGAYLYIKQFADSESEIKVSYPSKYTIEKDLHLSNTTIESCIRILADLGLITVASGFYVKGKNSETYTPVRNIFFIGRVEIDIDLCKKTLEGIYSSTVYVKEELEDKQIQYIKKSK